MDTAAIVGLVLQTVVIVTAIVATFVKTRERIVVLEERYKFIEINTTHLQEDHTHLSTRVDGISRKVARIEGQCKANHG